MSKEEKESCYYCGECLCSLGWRTTEPKYCLDCGGQNIRRDAHYDNMKSPLPILPFVLAAIVGVMFMIINLWVVVE